jgi:hypothetical protein
MGKTMKKSTIIWGEKHSVTLANFNDSHLKEIENLARQNIGPKAAFARAAAAKAVAQAKTNPKMKNAYVKVGLIDGALVLRCKEKKFFGDIEIDATLVTDYRAKSLAYMQVLMDELERENERQRLELERITEEKERQKRLKEIMERKDKDGTSLRERLLLAAQTAQKLGIGNYAQTKLQVQGLKPMIPQYHGEVMDRKQNRYGRYLPGLKKVWDEKVDGKVSFTDWLDAVEKNDTTVPGVVEARAVTNPEVRGGKVVQPEGVAGGLMVYLDDEARKGYVATASKGVLTGLTVKNDSLIFVIGPDNKLYVGSKKHTTAGKREAFNHSSFFSGAPVKSAGTLTVAGGKVTHINDQSGHYAPTPAMVRAAVRKIGGGDANWLKTVEVTVGGVSSPGDAFMNEQAKAEGVAIWGKYSIGSVNRVQAEAYLKASPDGSWLVREGTGQALVFSVRQGTAYKHEYVHLIGGAGLDRKKLLTKAKLPQVNLDEQPETETEEVTPPPTRPTRPNRPTQTTQPKPSQPKPNQPKPSQPKPSQPQPTTAPTSTLNPGVDASLRRSPAWHGDLNRAGSIALLTGKPDAWLLRVGQGNVIALSYNDGGTIKHRLINSDGEYNTYQAWTGPRQGSMVRP